MSHKREHVISDWLAVIDDLSIRPLDRHYTDAQYAAVREVYRVLLGMTRACSDEALALLAQKLAKAKELVPDDMQKAVTTDFRGEYVPRIFTLAQEVCDGKEAPRNEHTSKEGHRRVGQ